jgi:hypothetical protein
MLLGFQLASDPLTPTSVLVAQWGAWGLIIVALSIAVLRLWSDLIKANGTHLAAIEKLHTEHNKEHAEWQQELIEEHRVRLQEAKENTKAMLQLAERSQEAISTLHDLVRRYKSLSPPPSKLP